MLLEKDVVDAVCAKLVSKGYNIIQTRNTKQRGDDITADRKGSVYRKFIIEAKGATSSRKTSQRYGERFDSAQVRVHVAEAYWKASGVLSQRTDDGELIAGIALPDDENHRRMVAAIDSALDTLGIVVFWVKDDGKVNICAKRDI